MTETKQQNDNKNKCNDGNEKQVCCEQMFEMMQKFMGNQKGDRDCADMMDKMGCVTPHKP